MAGGNSRHSIIIKPVTAVEASSRRNCTAMLLYSRWILHVLSSVGAYGGDLTQRLCYTTGVEDARMALSLHESVFHNVLRQCVIFLPCAPFVSCYM